MLGVDYAGGRPGGAALKAKGYDFACRYLSSGGPGLPGKLLLPDEAADLRGAGVDIVSNFESTATTMLGGAAQGVADAQEALAQHNACGGPPDRPIYFSADWDASGGQLNLIAAYLAAAAGVLGGVQRVGIYGSASVVDWCLANGHATWGWQTDAWSYGARSPGAHIHQRIQQDTVNGVAVDVNESLTGDFGQWGAQGEDMDPTDKKVAADTLSTAGDAAQISSDVRNLVLDPTRGILHQLWVISGQVSALATAVAALATAAPATPSSPGAPAAAVDMAAVAAAAQAGAATALAAIRLQAVKP